MNITVLLGGFSAERDVSLASGLRIAAALRSRGHAVTCVDPAAGELSEARERELLAEGVGTRPPSLEALASLGAGGGGPGIPPSIVEWPAVRDAEVVFLALHGGQGEDGTLQALFDMAGIRYTGSGHLGSALAMDKHLSKILFRAAGVGTADWVMAPPPTSADGVLRSRFRRDVDAIGYPIVIKPSKQGSTVGLTIVRDPGELDAAVAEAFRYDDEVMAERFVAGRELTVGILGMAALPVIEIVSRNEIYDYHAKYTAGMAQEFVADLGHDAVSRLHEQSILAFEALKLRGYARVDFRMDELGNFYCLEANTLPGMTELSLIPQAAAAAGILFPELCERIVSLAAEAGTRKPEASGSAVGR
jgi:D-alanine-D-alanine ligase